MYAQKRIFIIMLTVLGSLLLLIGILAIVNKQIIKKSNMGKSRHILLLGASIGKAWNFPKWPERMEKKAYRFEMIPIYSFDKSKALDEILIRPKRKFRLNKTYIKNFFKHPQKKPDVLIIKECAAYFPGNIGEYKRLVKKWIAQCNEARIKPILTTVIPVTDKNTQKNKNRLKSLMDYNTWIREYSINNNIDYIDFEASLRISEKSRSLKQDLADKDGLHLNKKAYDILDILLLKKMEQIYD